MFQSNFGFDTNSEILSNPDKMRKFYRKPSIDASCKICFIEVSKEKILSIWPTRTKNFKWKIVGNSLCNFCKLDEDYSHYFITCAFLNEFWTTFQNLMKGLDIETKITSKHIVLECKIDDNNYLTLHFLITVVGFSIYKSYYISEQKTKYIQMFIEYLSMNILKE